MNEPKTKTTFKKEFDCQYEAERFLVGLLNYPRLVAAVTDFQEHVRSKLKYEELSDDEQRVWEGVSDEFYARLKLCDVLPFE